MTRRPKEGEYNNYFKSYIELTRGADALQNIEDSTAQLIRSIENLPEGKWDYRYAEGKWTVQQLIRHIIDTDVVFTYRALSIARGHTNPLPGFDHEAWIIPGYWQPEPPNALIGQLKQGRNFFTTLFKSIPQDRLHIIGEANGNPITPNAIAFIMAGHALHHLHILHERY